MIRSGRLEGRYTMHTRIALIVSAAALLLVQGCATSYVPLRPYAVAATANPARLPARAANPPVSAASPVAPAAPAPATPGTTAPETGVSGLSIGELLQMLQARRPQLDIAADLQARGLRVAPAPADFDVLAAAGASPELLQVLGATPAQVEAYIANGGVAPADTRADPTPMFVQPIPFYDAAYPWVPFSFGLGFGYYAGSAHYWGYAPYRAYPPLRIGGWRYTHIPRAIHPHVHPGRGAPRGSGLRSRR
jgi:hypothetical protein